MPAVLFFASKRLRRNGFRFDREVGALESKRKTPWTVFGFLGVFWEFGFLGAKVIDEDLRNKASVKKKKSNRPGCSKYFL